MTVHVPDTPAAATLTVRSERKNLWPVPTLTVRLADADAFNDALARIILQEEQKMIGTAAPTEVAGIATGLSAYWLHFNVLNWPYPEIEIFRSIVIASIREWLSDVGDPDAPEMQIAGISCWANVLRYGERLTVHHHDPAFLSAHYTVQSGFENAAPPPPGDSGATVYFRPGFMDRTHGGDAFLAPSPWDDDWRFESRAAPGRLFLFPSFIRHEVRPYLGPTQRISIAMDVFLRQQKLPIHFGGSRWFVPR